MKKITPLFVLFTAIVNANNILPNSIVNASWLEKNINNVKILDVRKQLHTYYDEGHIKNAILVDNQKVRVTRNINGKVLTRLIPSRSKFDKFIASHSINSDDTIIITNEGKTPGNFVASTRLYWQFKVYGFENVAILDGGNKNYKNETLEDFSTIKIKNFIGNFKTTSTNKKILSNINDIKNALKYQNKTIIDVRSLRFHIGLEKRDYVKNYGHIINTKHFPFKFLHPLKNNNIIFSKEKLINLFLRMNINPYEPIILYCNSGFEASSVWFALYEIIGNKNVSVYDAGLHEWTKNVKNKMSMINKK